VASFETIASGIARHSGAHVDAPTVPAAFERPDHGVPAGLDRLSRGRLRSGGRAALVRDRHVVGITTNDPLADLLARLLKDDRIGI
jgi:hypothetical protein